MSEKEKEDTGPRYNIKVKTGEEIEALPEEIYEGTGWEPFINKPNQYDNSLRHVRG